MHQRGLLLDRDGVINIDHGYVGTKERFEFQDGIFPLLRAAQDKGYRIAIITNQAAVARGYYGVKDFDTLTKWMLGEFAAQGIAIGAVKACFCHTEGKGDYARESFWRKPNPGMILEAANELGLDLSRSIFLGDQITDMQAAEKAGVGKRILLTHGKDVVCEGAVSLSTLGDVVAYLL